MRFLDTGRPIDVLHKSSASSLEFVPLSFPRQLITILSLGGARNIRVRNCLHASQPESRELQVELRWRCDNRIVVSDRLPSGTQEKERERETELSNSHITTQS